MAFEAVVNARREAQSELAALREAIKLRAERREAERQKRVEKEKSIEKMIADTARDHLLSAHSILSPSVVDNIHINITIAEMEKECRTEAAIIKYILSQLIDGVMYGNWHSVLEEKRRLHGYITTIPYA